jgi:hypothetical protein
LHHAKAVHDQVRLYQCECNDDERDPAHGWVNLLRRSEPQKQHHIVKSQQHLRNENPVADDGVIHTGDQVAAVYDVNVHGIQNQNAHLVAQCPEHCKQENLEICVVGARVFCEMIKNNTSRKC